MRRILFYELYSTVYIQLEGLSEHAVTLSDHAERMWDLDEVDLDPFYASVRMRKRGVR